MSATSEQTITSLEVAKLTCKNHKEVLRDIRNILSQLEDGVEHNYTQSLCVGKPWTGWTREGVTFFYTLLEKNGIVPLRERK